MKVTIQPSRLKGSVAAVASKSYAHRAVIAAALSNAETEIILNTSSQDIEATLSCIEALGAKWEKSEKGIKVYPIVRAEKFPTLDCNESGSTARFLMPVAAALYNQSRFEGRGRLTQRPFDPLLAAMSLKGVATSSGHIPLTLSGGLKGGKYEIAGNISSQYISGLMFALPLISGGEICLTTPLESAAYVDMTIEVMAQFGVKVIKTSDRYVVSEGRYLSPGEYRVEGDWSNSAFWLAANRMGALIEVSGLNPSSTQGDKRILEAVGKDEIDAAEIPDLVPILAVYAASKNGQTKIVNAARLRLKESDRLHTVAQTLSALGGDIEEFKDGLVINGTGCLKGGRVDGAGDHRIIMSAAIAAVICKSAVEITGAEAVNKSYPTFFEDYKRLGGDINVTGD
ncbi:MAG: 3-phosphoshikimate 1-carboxyvinyltransferase [Bacillota bacterium]|nr:3-phosphoshikimate 1-carboxyvinyltransferase [Bacillota bacterium]